MEIEDTVLVYHEDARVFEETAQEERDMEFSLVNSNKPFYSYRIKGQPYILLSFMYTYGRECERAFWKRVMESV